MAAAASSSWEWTARRLNAQSWRTRTCRDAWERVVLRRRSGRPAGGCRGLRAHTGRDPPPGGLRPVTGNPGVRDRRRWRPGPRQARSDGTGSCLADVVIVTTTTRAGRTRARSGGRPARGGRRDRRRDCSRGGGDRREAIARRGHRNRHVEPGAMRLGHGAGRDQRQAGHETGFQEIGGRSTLRRPGQPSALEAAGPRNWGGVGVIPVTWPRSLR